MRYFLITFMRKPGGQIDEQVTVAKKVKPSDLQTCNVILDYAKKKVDPQADTFRLLIMITVQLLSFLSVCLALIYTNQSNNLVLHLLGLALTLIVVQTVFIVRRLKSTDEF